MGKPAALVERDAIMHRRIVLALIGAIVVVLALAGCGLAAGKGSSEVTLTVTRDFGAISVGSVFEHRVPGSQTVLHMLERSFQVRRVPGRRIGRVDQRL